MSGTGTSVGDAGGAVGTAVEAGPFDGPLVEGVFTADPSGHVWDGVLYVYASHDEETGAQPDDDGSHFDMRDYRVLELRDLAGPVIEHAVLHVDDVPWAQRQMWAPDAARRGDTYYLFFPAKDAEGVFRIGVATSSSPTGPFIAECTPIEGVGSIDPAVLVDDDDAAYLYVGGIMGGQLQRWDGGTYTGVDRYPAPGEPALGPRVARLTDDLLALAEPTREVVVTDAEGVPLTQDDPRRFFEGPWVSRIDGVYHLLYSTGGAHTLVHATSDSPYGPFTYRGTVLEPVAGWTTQGSLVQLDGAWYLLYHDARASGRDHLRDVRLAPLTVHPDGRLTADPR